MRNVGWVAGCGVLVCGMALAAPRASASDAVASGTVTKSMGHYFCVALEDPTPAAPKGKAYYSGVFEAEGNSLNPVRAAYAAFLQEKYSYAQDPTTFDSSVQCVGTRSAEEAAATEQARMKPGKTFNASGTFETGWTYSAQ